MSSTKENKKEGRVKKLIERFKKGKEDQIGLIIIIILCLWFALNVIMTVLGANTIAKSGGTKYEGLIIAMIVLLWIFPFPFYFIWLIVLAVFSAKVIKNKNIKDVLLPTVS